MQWGDGSEAISKGEVVMKQAIHRFFSARNLGFNRLLRTSCRGLPKHAVLRAMQEVFEERDKIRPIQYGWEVRRRAISYVQEPENIPDIDEFDRMVRDKKQYEWTIYGLLTAIFVLLAVFL